MRTDRNTLLRGAALVGLVATASGCWLQTGGGPRNTRSNDLESTLTVDNVASLHQVWTHDDGVDLWSEPITSGGRIYTAVYRRQGDPTMVTLLAQARDASTGALVWEQPLTAPEPEIDAYSSVPIHFDDALWIAVRSSSMPDCSSTIHRLDPRTGTILSSDPAAIGSELIADGDVVVRIEYEGCTTTPKLVVRNRSTRAVLWTFTPQEGSVATTTPVVGDGRIVIGIDGNQKAALYAFSTEGCGRTTCEPLWTHATTGQMVVTNRPTLTPNGDVVIETATHLDDRLHVVLAAHSIDDGTIRWSADTSVVTSSYAPRGVAVAQDTVFSIIQREDQGLTPLLAAHPVSGCEASPCDPAWTAELPDGRLSEPTVGGGVVYIGVDDVALPGTVLAFPAAGCGSPACSPISRSTVFGSSGGDVPRLVLGSGHLFWMEVVRFAALAPAS